MTTAKELPTQDSQSARLALELHRVLSEVIRDADEVIERPQPTVSSLHRLHRATRQLRTWLALWSELAGPNDRKRLRPLDARLRRLARVIGRIRDRDVALGLLERFSTKPRREPVRLAQYRAELKAEARAGRKHLRSHLLAERESGLFAHVDAAVKGRASPLPSTQLRRVLAAHRQAGVDQMSEALRSARRRPTMRRLHRLRQRVRRLRQLSELTSLVDPDAELPSDGPLRRLQRGLGRIHDIDVVLAGLDPLLQPSAWAQALRKERRRKRKSIVEALRS
jgi:CHAD domain-containing protein